MLPAGSPGRRRNGKPLSLSRALPVHLARLASTHYTALFRAVDEGSPVRRDQRRMNYDPSNPLIVQGDRTVLVEVDNPRYPEARDALAPFAELEKSPEHIHTYRLTNLSLWNAAASGLAAQAMVDVLGKYSKFPLPASLAPDLAQVVSR